MATEIKPEILKTSSSLSNVFHSVLVGVLAGGLVFGMLVAAYNWKDFYKSITRQDITTTSVTILGDDGKPQFVLDKYGICKVSGTTRVKILDNVAGTIELNVDRVAAKGITAKAIDGDVTSSNSFVYVDKRGNRIIVEDHLNTRKIGDAP